MKSLKGLLLSFVLIVLITPSYAQSLSFKKEVKGNYQSALITIAKNFRNAQKVIQYSDEKTGTIVIRALFDFSPYSDLSSYQSANGIIHYNLTITRKDSSTIIIVIEDFEHDTHKIGDSDGYYSFGKVTTNVDAPKIEASISNKKWRQKVWETIKQSCQSHADSLFIIFETK